MSKWLYWMGISAVSAVGNSITVYLGTVTFDPELLSNMAFWKAMVLTIALAVLKDIGLHLKDAPKFFDGLPPQEPPKGD